MATRHFVFPYKGVVTPQAIRAKEDALEIFLNRLDFSDDPDNPNHNHDTEYSQLGHEHTDYVEATEAITQPGTAAVGDIWIEVDDPSGDILSVHVYTTDGWKEIADVDQGVVKAINDLLDVNTAGVADYDVLLYNSGTWTPVPLVSGDANNQASLGTDDGIYVPPGGTSSPLTTKGDIWVYDTDDARLPIGTDDHFLAADSSDPQGMVWRAIVEADISDLAHFSGAWGDITGKPSTFPPDAHTIASHSDTTATGPELEELTDGSETTLHSHAATGLSSPLTTKGDLWGYDTSNARVPVGTNGQFLKADSADAQGVIWATLVEADISDLGNYTVVGHTHVEANITDLDHYDSTDFAADFGAADLADLSSRPHSALTGVGVDDHHNQVHGLVSSDHTVAGLTAGHGLMALTATTFGFRALVEADISDLGSYAVTGHTHVEANITDLDHYDSGDFATDHGGASHPYLADSADYSTISGNDAATNVTGAELEELTDGSTTSLHTHSGVDHPDGDHEHGGLVGLGDDDHTQYHTDGRALTWLGTRDLEDVGDVVLTAVGAGELLKWSGTQWINNTLAEAGISAVGHTHVEANITDLDHYDTADANTDIDARVTKTFVEALTIDITEAQITDLAHFSGAWGDITGKPATFPPSAHTIASHSDTTATGLELDELTDGSETTLHSHADTGLSSPLTTKGDLWGYDTGNARVPVGTNGQFLKADSADAQGVVWATLVEADISDLGNYTVVGHTHVEANITDLAHFSGAWGDITGKPSTFPPSAHTIESHSDVTLTSIGTGELLKWSGTAWINNTLAEAGIATSGHGHGQLHDEAHTVASHSDTTATGTELDTLTDGSNADALHSHAGIDHPDGDHDHGGLNGLGDDDHTQYHTDGRALTWLGTRDLEDVGDVTLTAIGTGELLKWSGTAWVNNTLSEAGIAAASHNHTESDITDLTHYTTSDFTTDFAAESLANLAIRAHANLTGIGTDDHHARYTDAEAAAKIAADDLYVQVAGDTMSGNLDLGGNELRGVERIRDDAVATRIRVFPNATGDIFWYAPDGTSIIWQYDHSRTDFRMYEDLDLEANTLKNIADPTGDTHVGDRAYNDARYTLASGGPYLPLTGGTLSGALDISSGGLDVSGENITGIGSAFVDRVRADGGTLAFADDTNVTRLQIETNAADGDIVLYDESGTIKILLWDASQGSMDFRAGADITMNNAGFISSPLDPTSDSHVGDRGYNDARYAAIAAESYDYSDISGNDAATDVTGAELEELTDGSTTSLHVHSGAGHNHDSDYVELTGDTMSGNLQVDADAPSLILDRNTQGGGAALLYFETNSAIKGSLGLATTSNEDIYLSADDGDLYIRAQNAGAGPRDMRFQVDDGTGTLRSRFVIDGDAYLNFYGTDGVRVGYWSDTALTMDNNINVNGNVLYNPLDPTAGSHVGDRDYNDARYTLASGGPYLPLAGGTLTGAALFTTVSDQVRLRKATATSYAHLRYEDEAGIVRWRLSTGNVTDDHFYLFAYDGAGAYSATVLEVREDIEQIVSSYATVVDEELTVLNSDSSASYLNYNNSGQNYITHEASEFTTFRKADGTSHLTINDDGVYAYVNTYFGTDNGNDKVYIGRYGTAGNQNAYIVAGTADEDLAVGIVLQTRNSSGSITSPFWLRADLGELELDYDLVMSGEIRDPSDPTAGNMVGDRDYNDARYLNLTADESLTGWLTITSPNETLKLVGGTSSANYISFYRESAGTRTGYIGHGNTGADHFYVNSDNGHIYLQALNAGAAASNIIATADDATGTNQSRMLIDGDGPTYFYNNAGVEKFRVDTSLIRFFDAMRVDDAAPSFQMDRNSQGSGQASVIFSTADTSYGQIGLTSTGSEVFQMVSFDGDIAFNARGDGVARNITMTADDATGTAQQRFILDGDGGFVFKDDTAVTRVTFVDNGQTLYIEGDSGGSGTTYMGFYRNSGAAARTGYVGAADPASDAFFVVSEEGHLYLRAQAAANAQNIYLQADDAAGTLRSRIVIDGDGPTYFYQSDGTQVAFINAGAFNLGGTGYLMAPADPAAGTHVGDRDYNDARYAMGSHNHDSDYVELTGDTMSGALQIDADAANLILDRNTTGGGYGVVYFETNSIIKGYVGQGSLSGDNIYLASQDSDIYIDAHNTGAASQDIYLRADDSGGTLRNRIWIDGDGNTIFYNRDGNSSFWVDWSGDVNFGGHDILDVQLIQSQDQDLYLQAINSGAAAQNIRMYADNAAGTLTERLYIDGDGIIYMSTKTGASMLNVNDNSVDIYGELNYASTGNFYIDNGATDQDLYLRTHNGTGQQTRIFIDGSADTIGLYSHNGVEAVRLSGSDVLPITGGDLGSSTYKWAEVYATDILQVDVIEGQTSGDLDIQTVNGDMRYRARSSGAASESHYFYADYNGTEYTRMVIWGNNEIEMRWRDGNTMARFYDNSWVPGTTGATSLGTSSLVFDEAHIDTLYVDRGAAGTPSLTTSQDSNTGIYFGLESFSFVANTVEGSYKGVQYADVLEVSSDIRTVGSGKGYQHNTLPTYNNVNGSMRWMGTNTDMAQAHTSSSLSTKQNVQPIRTDGGSVFDRLDPIHFHYIDNHPFKDRWKGRRPIPEKRAELDEVIRDHGQKSPGSVDDEWYEDVDYWEGFENPAMGRMGFSYEQMQEVAPQWAYDTDGMEAVSYEGMLPDFMAWAVATIKDLRDRVRELETV